MRREGDACFRAAELRQGGFDFANVGMGGEAVGEEILVRLRVAERAGAPAPGSGHAALCIDNDTLELDQALFRQRRQSEERGRRIAAGIRKACCARDQRPLSWQLGQSVRPAFDEAMIAADVHDLRRPRDARERIARLTRRQRYEEQLERRQLLRLERLDDERAFVAAREPGKTLHERLPGARLAGNVGELEARMARDQAQELASAVAAHAYDAYARHSALLGLYSPNGTAPARAASHSLHEPLSCRNTVSYPRKRSSVADTISRERARRACALPTLPRRCRPSSHTSSRLKFSQQ